MGLLSFIWLALPMDKQIGTVAMQLPLGRPSQLARYLSARLLLQMGDCVGDGFQAALWVAHSLSFYSFQPQRN